MERSKLERTEEWRKWMMEIPALSFPADVKVAIIPPFAGAIARFIASKGENSVSVYLDCYDSLGCYGEPYWEIYPYEEDVYRCAMNEADKLMEAIVHSLNES